MPSLLRPTTRLAGRRVAPLLIAADLVRESRNHWTTQLTPRQRERLVALLKESHGRWGNLTTKQQGELRNLVSDLKVGTFAKHAAATASGFRDPKKAAKRRK